MESKFYRILFLLIFLISFQLNTIKCDDLDAPINGTDYPNIECGKKNPKKPKDCTKYGTDSGMLCCWVEKNSDKNGKCTLLSHIKADEKKIDGIKEFKYGEKWDCGNKSNYLYINIILIFSLFLLFSF